MIERVKGGRRKLTDAEVQAAVISQDLDALLAWASGTSGVAGPVHARLMLARAFTQADPGTITKAHRRTAAAIGLPDKSRLFEPPAAPRHAVHVPLVADAGQLGFVRLMHLVYDPSVHGGYDLPFDADAHAAVSDAIAAAWHRQRPGPHVEGCRFMTTNPDALRGMGRLHGPSLGAAAFVSAMSLWSYRPVRPGTVITGRLVGKRVGDVGKLGAKLEALTAHRGGLKRVIVPAGRADEVRKALGESGLTVIGVDHVDELLEAALQAEVRRPDALRHRVPELRRKFERGWDGFSWYALREQAERMALELPEGRPELRVEVMSMLGAAHSHLGAMQESLAVLSDTARFAELPDNRSRIPDLALAHLYQHLSMTCWRLGRIAEGRKAARVALAASKHGRLIAEVYKSLGCAGLVEMGAGRPAKAVEHFRESLHHVHDHAPEGCCRTHGYLADALARAGELRAAIKEYEAGLEHLNGAPEGVAGNLREAWLRTSFGGALVAAGKNDRAMSVLDVPAVHKAIAEAPLPGLYARRHLGMALCRAGDFERGYDLLYASPNAYGAALEPGLSFMAAVNVLCEASARLHAGHWSGDIGGRAGRLLDSVPAHIDDRKIRASHARAAGALHTADTAPGRAAAALDKLLDRCVRIA